MASFTHVVQVSKHFSQSILCAHSVWSNHRRVILSHTKPCTNNNQKPCICFGWPFLLDYCWIRLFDTSNKILLPRLFQSKQGYRTIADVTPLSARLGTTSIYPLVVNCSRSSKRKYSEESLRELFKSSEALVEFWLVSWYFQIQVHYKLICHGLIIPI